VVWQKSTPSDLTALAHRQLEAVNGATRVSQPAALGRCASRRRAGLSVGPGAVP
jgi:hypothetical protein